MTRIINNDACAARYPRLMRAMKWAACLSHTEAAGCLRTLAQVNAGTLPVDDLRYGGGEAVRHFGGPAAVLAAAIRCRHATRIDKRRLRDLARSCARTWHAGGSAQWEYDIYDADGKLIGHTRHEEWEAWHQALTAVGRRSTHYDYPDITTGCTTYFT